MLTLAEVTRLRANPQVAYAEYAAVKATAQAMGRFIDPQEIPAAADVIRRRGDDWCCTVLGFSADFLHVSVTESRMLIVADRQGLDPPEPRWLTGWKQESAERQARAGAQHAADRKRGQAAYEAALRDCTVELEARPNPVARVRHGLREAVVHAVPRADVVSGRARKHRAGRALCESENRTRPMLLGDPADVPVTCVRCLYWMTRVRREGEPPAPSHWGAALFGATQVRLTPTGGTWDVVGYDQGTGQVTVSRQPTGEGATHPVTLTVDQAQVEPIDRETE